MRAVLVLTALGVLSACARTEAPSNQAAPANAAVPANAAAPANSAAPTPAAASSAATLPTGFPGTDPDARAAECYVYLSLAMQDGGSAGGYDEVAMSQARDQWRSDLRQRLTEDETSQLIGSSVNPLSPTPVAQRNMAAAWCTANAVEVDPPDPS